MSYVHSKKNQSLCIISSWLSSKFFDLSLHLLFFPLTGTVHCILPTIRLCSYIVRASCDWAAAGNAELRWPSPVPEVRLRLRQAAGRRRQPVVVYF